MNGKHLSCLLICLLLSIMLATKVNAASEQIVNGGFESGDLSGWTIENGEVEVIDFWSHSGNYSACLPGSLSYSGISQNFSGVTAVSKLELWAMCYNSLSQHIYVNVTYSDDSVQKIDCGVVNQPGGEFKEFDITTQLTVGKTIVKIVVWQQSGYDMYVDDVSLIGEKASQGSQGNDGGTLPNYSVRFGLSDVNLGSVSSGREIRFNMPFVASASVTISIVRLEGDGADWVRLIDVLPKTFPASSSLQMVLKIPGNATAKAYTVRVAATASVSGYTVSDSAEIHFTVGYGPIETISGFIENAEGVLRDFIENAKATVTRLLGDPRILWLFILLVIILAYYSLRKR
jgi:hypothetical protein